MSRGQSRDRLVLPECTFLSCSEEVKVLTNRVANIEESCHLIKPLT